MVDIYHRSATCSHCGVTFQANLFTESMEGESESILGITFLGLFENGNYDDAVRLFDETVWSENNLPDLSMVAAEAFVRSFGARRLAFGEYRSRLRQLLRQHALRNGTGDPDPDMFSFAFIGERYIDMLRGWAADCRGSEDDEDFMECMEAFGKFPIDEMYAGMIPHMPYSDRYTHDRIMAVIDEYASGTDRDRNGIIEDIVREVCRSNGDLCGLFGCFVSLGMEEDLVIAARFCRSVIRTGQDEDTARALARLFSGSYGMRTNLTRGIGQSIWENILSAPFFLVDHGAGLCSDGLSLRIDGPDGTVVDVRQTIGSSLSKNVLLKRMVPYDVHVGMDGLSEHFRMVPVCTVQPMKPIECCRWRFETELRLVSTGTIIVYRRV